MGRVIWGILSSTVLSTPSHANCALAEPLGENRAYLPAADLAQKLRDTQTPLFGVESQKSLAEFDILCFSLSYELGATNILEMLTLAGIPLTWRERAAGNYPLIFAGGNL